MEKFEFLEHTADVKFRSYGETLEEAFKNAGLALKKTILGKNEIKGKMEKTFTINTKDKEALLREFLDEFLYLLEGENFVIKDIENIEIKRNNGYQLKARVIGDKTSKYDISNSVKAVTYNDMFIRKNKKWTCQVVLDV